MKKVYMMTKEKELQLLPDELTWIVIVCPNCGTEHGLDISSKNLAERVQKAERFFTCGICGNGYEPILMQALQSLLLFHKNMKQSKSKVFFRLYVKESNNKENQQ